MLHKIGIIMNGVTGRMGTNQHLMRSIVAIIKQGGVKVSDSEYIMPDPVLVGRNEIKLKKLAEMAGVEKWTTDLDSVMNDPQYLIYFDAQTTGRRADAVIQAAKAGKHVYCEKPVATSTASALELYRVCEEAGVKHGVVQDKLWLPGLLKLKRLMENDFFGKILSVRGEFGYWVFEGHTVPAQRPSWNYRKEDDGGIIVDMLCHWRYVLDNLFGEVKSVSCLGATHIPERVDELGKPYKCTADDAAYATFELDGGVIAHFNSSWVPACAAMICSHCMLTEQKVLQLPVCANAGPNITEILQSRYGIPIFRTQSIFTKAGVKFRSRKFSTTRLRPNGNCS